MLSFTWSAFDRGPVARVLELAVRCQESEGEYSLTEELASLVRLIDGSNEAGWLCPVTTVTALLDLTADVVASAAASLPPDFTALLTRAADGMDPAEYLHLLASTLRLVEQDVRGDLQVLPGAGWEAWVRFRMLRGFYDNWIADPEYGTAAEAIQAGITSEHPYCGDFLGPVTAEARYALTHLRSSPEARERLARVAPWAAEGTLTALLEAVDDHLREAHPS
ncbi:hypothetical protein [Streptomyces sp. NPDC020362]|uniref:hypothetical protein n=1 Tax=unclassified Streptomyces TaxID=2593676 RepID=UPI000A4DACB9